MINDFGEAKNIMDLRSILLHEKANGKLLGNELLALNWQTDGLAILGA